jgi:hypothetical protein
VETIINVNRHPFLVRVGDVNSVESAGPNRSLELHRKDHVGGREDSA